MRFWLTSDHTGGGELMVSSLSLCNEMDGAISCWLTSDYTGGEELMVRSLSLCNRMDGAMRCWLINDNTRGEELMVRSLSLCNGSTRPDDLDIMHCASRLVKAVSCSLGDLTSTTLALVTCVIRNASYATVAGATSQD